MAEPAAAPKENTAPEISTLEGATAALTELRNSLNDKSDETKNAAIEAMTKGRKFVEQGTAEALQAFQTEITMWQNVLLDTDSREEFYDDLRKEVTSTSRELLKSFQESTKALHDQVQEEGVFDMVGKWTEGIFKNVKMPAFVKAMGIENLSDVGDLVSRLAKKAYFSFMANLDQYVPDWMRGMVESQIAGSKEMLLELDAEDGVSDVVKIMRKTRKNFRIPWDGVVWQNWRSAFDAGKKENPSLSPRIFVRQHILTFITETNDQTLTTLPMKKITAPKVEKPVPTAPVVPPVPAATPAAAPSSAAPTEAPPAA